MSTTDAITTITGRDPQAEADVTTIWRQVPVTTWMGMGALPRNVLRHPDGLQVTIYRGAGTHRALLFIKLNARDLYDVEIGHTVRLDWRPLAQALDVHTEDLDEVLRDLYDSVSY